MKGILGKLMTMIANLRYVAMEYFYIFFLWILKLFKIQFQKMKKNKNSKRLEKACGNLGAEIYALYKDGESNWKEYPAVENQLKLVEESEAKVFEIDAAIQKIQEDFGRKRQQIKEKYAAKKAASQPEPTEDQ